MKKSMFLVVIVVLFSLTSFGQYPGQTNDEKKDVPDIITYVDEKPVIFNIGDVKWIHDPRNKALIMFRGQQDSILTEIINWISRKTDDSGFIATPVVKVTGTKIDPFILFTRKELREQDNKKKLVELTKYNTYVITIQKCTYAEDFDDVEYARYKGIKVVPATPSNHVPPVVAAENKTQKPTRSSAFKPRVKYPRN